MKQLVGITIIGVSVIWIIFAQGTLQDLEDDLESTSIVFKSKILALVCAFVVGLLSSYRLIRRTLLLRRV